MEVCKKCNDRFGDDSVHCMYAWRKEKENNVLVRVNKFKCKYVQHLSLN